MYLSVGLWKMGRKAGARSLKSTLSLYLAPWTHASIDHKRCECVTPTPSLTLSPPCVVLLLLNDVMILWYRMHWYSSHCHLPPPSCGVEAADVSYLSHTLLRFSPPKQTFLLFPKHLLLLPSFNTSSPTHHPWLVPGSCDHRTSHVRPRWCNKTRQSSVHRGGAFWWRSIGVSPRILIAWLCGTWHAQLLMQLVTRLPRNKEHNFDSCWEGLI